SALLLLWMLTFQILYNHPIQVYPSPSRIATAIYLFGDIIGTTGIVMHTAALMSLVLLILRRWQLPFGTFTFLIGLHYLMLAPQHYTYSALLPLLVGMLLAGFACDLLYARLKPSYDQPA